MQDATKPIWFKEQENKKTFSEYKIFVATPVHSDCSIHYTQALLKFQQECMLRGILTTFCLLKSSLVTQGRNLCLSNFLKEKKYTHLLFIDSDIDFEFNTIMKMLEADKNVIACAYPMKTINWEKIWKRINEGTIKNKRDLEVSGNIYPLKVKDQNNILVNNGIMEVTHAPTGCMLIKRETFDKMIEKYSDLKIEQPTVLNGNTENTSVMYNFFDTFYDKENKKYYGEDFGFCQKWTDIGGKCYVYINDYISHVGEHCYVGRFLDDLQNIRNIDESDKNK
jgi:hypothetical protein